MKAADRTILIALAGIGLLAAFWLLVVSPKREELSELNTRAGELRSSISSLEAEASAGESARDAFPSHYARMVVLGKAVPSGHEEPDLIVGLDRIGQRAEVSFRSIELTQDAALPAAGPALSETDQSQQESEQPSDSSDEGETSTASATPQAVPTEAVASTLPLGATIGPAGLGVMGWNVQFTGDFFDINSVLAAIDRSVRFHRKAARTDGRLVTVDGFSLTMKGPAQVPKLIANMALRSYIVPPDQGVMLGATPAGPSAAAPATTPVSQGVSP